MSGTNHTVGGTVFTGIFCSFWNLNIFEKPMYLFFTVLFSILADIDHTKSPIGKLFYPIARYLDRNFGHRTITHSLLFYSILGILIAFIESIISNDFNITLIYSFAYLSHLIFDMMTKQGVPLFYPFRRNPCVIPGNPELRFKSSDLKTESFLLLFFLLVGISCKPLITNGFWTSYNRQFAQQKHLANEFKNSPNLIAVNYTIWENGNYKSGSGFVITADKSKAIIYRPGTKIFKTIIDNEVSPEWSIYPTNHKIIINEQYFIDINQDSLIKLSQNKAILSLKIHSNKQFSYWKDNKPHASSNADFEYIYNPKLQFIQDSINNKIINEIELLKYELQKSKSEKKQHQENTIRTNDSLISINEKIDNGDFYIREKLLPKAIELQKKIRDLKPYSDNSPKLFIQLKHLQEELNSKKEITKISGFIQWQEFPEPYTN